MARAMADRDANGAIADGPGVHRGGWRAYVPLAEAGLAAAREPTKAMVDEGDTAAIDLWTHNGLDGYGSNGSDRPSIVIFQAMIDKALGD